MSFVWLRVIFRLVGPPSITSSWPLHGIVLSDMLQLGVYSFSARFRPQQQVRQTEVPVEVGEFC